jgi:FAD/FMN-containing dehydrogenase
VLVENHTMKPYKRRVLGTYVLLEQSLKTVAREGQRIAAAKSLDRAANPSRLMVRWERASAPLETIDFKGYRYDTYRSAASGARERRWTGVPATIRMPVFGVTSTREVDLPRAWWLMPEQTALIEKLHAHGIQMDVQEAPRTLALEVARLANGKDRSAPQRAVTTMTVPAGAVRIPARQPFHLLAAALLEAESDDSFLANGWFDQSLPPESTLARRLLAPWADRMMETDAALRAQFQSAVAGDAALAADPQARLRWWLARSPYFERSRWTYPVFSERD